MRPWFQRLLCDPVSDDFKQTLPAFLKYEARSFTNSASVQLTFEENTTLTEWYFSPVGQEQLEGLLDATWQQMHHVAERAMPAHDARHAMFKVPASALLYLESEQVADAGRLGIFGALLHDHGRWAEERIFGAPGESMVHARLSFLLARELAEEFQLPALAVNQILYATVQHTAGAVPADPMALKLTVSADRDQLHGPEIVIRLLHHVVMDGSMASVYGEKPGMSVLDRLTHFLVNRLPGPLFSREGHVDHLQSTLATFILMAESQDESQARFAQLRGPAASRRSLPAGFDWSHAWSAAQANAGPSSDPLSALRTLLSAPNVVSNPRYLEQALDKLSHLPDAKRTRLAAALAWVDQERRALDAREAQDLAGIAHRYASDKPVALLASRLLQYGYA